MATKQNDPRAGFKVHVFETATNVKFDYKGYVISLAADGQETFVFSEDGHTVLELDGTGAHQVHEAVEWVNYIIST